MEEILTHHGLANEMGSAKPNATDKLKNGTFSALILGALACVLMGGAAVRSSFVGFAFYSLPGALILAVAARRYRRFNKTGLGPTAGASLSFRDTASVLLLFASGAMLGWVLSTQSLFLLALAICCFAWLPWHRLSFHSRYLKTSMCVVAAGVALAWFSLAGSPAPIILAAMAWFVSIGGWFALLKGK